MKILLFFYIFFYLFFANAFELVSKDEMAKSNNAPLKLTENLVMSPQNSRHP